MKQKALYRTVITISIVIVIAACSAPAAQLYKSKTYDEERAALVAADSAQRFSSDIELTPAESVLNQKLVALRRAMKFRYDSLGFFPPSQNFAKYKHHVSETRLYKLLRAMPKGAIHHLHPSAGVDFEWLVDEVTNYPEGYVYWDAPSEEYEKGQIHFFGKDEIPTGFRSAAELLQSEDNFKAELLELLTITNEPAVDSLDIWVEFQKVFKRIGGAYDYNPIFSDYLENVAQNLIDDNVMHMETRSFFGPKYTIDASGSSVYFPLDSTFQGIERATKNIQQKHPDFTHKAIYTSLRFFPAEKISEELVTAYQLRKKYPEFIKGFDLVAEEDNGHTTLFFDSVWLMRDSLQQVYGIDMPLYLHDGESNSRDVQNVYDAVVLGSKRIGHGFNLMYFPNVIDKVIANDICIEVSPLSNQMLGYVKDLRLHPAALLLSQGVQCSISSDDPAIFGYRGLSYDYWYSTMAWELDLRDIKKLVFNSLTYSTLDADEKQKALAKLRESWVEFVRYGNEFL